MARKRFTRHRPLFSSPLPKEVTKPKVKWVILPILWGALKRTCMALGAMMLFSIVLTVISLSKVSQPALPGMPDQMVLYLEFKDELLERPARPSFADPFAEARPTVSKIVDAIDRAAMDNRVKGIAARMYEGDFSLTHIQEIRAALARFKQTGKFTKIYSSSYGDGGNGMGRYYLASAFDERWMQPLGVISIAGLRAEVPFVRGVLDQIGITPQFFQKKEYKTAYESLTNSEISPENKRMLEDIVGGIKTRLLADIPTDLGKTPDEFNNLVDQGLFTADQALTEGLITHKNYIDVMVAQLKESLTGNPDYDKEFFVSVERYMNADKPKLALHKNPKVALIYITGPIMDTTGNHYSGEGVAAADEIAPVILEAAKDEKIQAIVLRIDSPGGSPVASESILRAIEKAKEEGKPVIVSMGSTAASGGYWIAAYADQIFASSTTLTGSIGVLGGKFSAGELWSKLGVNWNTDVAWGENAGIWSFNTKFSSAEAARMDMMLENIYTNFLARVAKGRNMTTEQVDKIARGRVWTGAQAQKIGLVDQIGGLVDTLNYTATLLGKTGKAELNIVTLPREKTFSEQIAELLGQSGAVYSGLRLQAALGKILEPFADDLTVLTRSSSSPALTYEPLRVE